MNIYSKLSDLAIRILRIEKKLKKREITTNISFHIDSNGHLIQTNN